MENSEQEVKYACYKCKEPLEEENLQSHPCFQVEVVVTENVLEEDIQLEYLQEGEEEAGPYTKVEYFEGGDSGNTLVEFVEESAEGPVEESANKFKKVTANGRRGEWSSDDIHRLLDIYIKNCKALPLQKGLHNHYLWDRVMRDLKPHGNFSRFLVQAKIKKLKKAGKAILDSGSDISKWPYLQQVIEIFRAEEEGLVRAANESEAPTPGEDDLDSDLNNTAPEEEEESDVVGLRRFTVKEARHLIEVYKKHLHKFFECGEPRKIAWDDIIADLDYGLAEKYTMYQIRAKIRNAQNTYRHIVEKKRKKPMTHWPLFADLAALAKVERNLAEQHGVPIAIYRWGGKLDPDAVLDKMCPSETGENTIKSPAELKGSSRWNMEETRELLSTYKKYLESIISSNKQDSKETWRAIAAEVNSIRRRKINYTGAKSKIDALRQIWEKNEKGYEISELLPLQEDMRDVFEMERDLLAADVQQESDEWTNQRPKESKRRNTHLQDDLETPVKKKKAMRGAFPTWFLQYRRDAERRHLEKIAVQERLLETIQRLFRKLH